MQETKISILNKKLKDLEELKLLLIQDKIYNRENGNERAAALYSLGVDVVETYTNIITYTPV